MPPPAVILNPDEAEEWEEDDDVKRDAGGWTNSLDLLRGKAARLVLFPVLDLAFATAVCNGFTSVALH